MGRFMYLFSASHKNKSNNAAQQRHRELNATIKYTDIIVKHNGIELFHYFFILKIMVKQVVTRATANEDLSRNVALK